MFGRKKENPVVDKIRYEEELAKLPKRDVSPGEFEAAAFAVGWEGRTVELFLKTPLFRGHVKVGGEGLRVVA